MKIEDLSKQEQAVVAEIRTLIAEAEPRRRWLTTLDFVAFASFALIGAAAYRLFL